MEGWPYQGIRPENANEAMHQDRRAKYRIGDMRCVSTKLPTRNTAQTDAELEELLEEVEKLPDTIEDDVVLLHRQVGPPTTEKVLNPRNEMLVTRHWLNQQRR
jgi:hypothetical protein